ncbi:hypothetical protein AAMO2058_000243700 [Amorphochlora amoebiformis]|uniref:Uncharacterized protein n=1 Tax=Amorphochlora amoebiformis TaxID=1561963 RepID=A0A7S0CMW2_9EUKA|mmetsp:Transcript_10420/g.16460  ORF Transcript_10420/g.16460 Transcript_10420/m.16460 type:complete len:186 (+) Transcript_10420:210-767(+)
MGVWMIVALFNDILSPETASVLPTTQSQYISVSYDSVMLLRGGAGIMRALRRKKGFRKRTGRPNKRHKGDKSKLTRLQRDRRHRNRLQASLKSRTYKDTLEDSDAESGDSIEKLTRSISQAKPKAKPKSDLEPGKKAREREKREAVRSERVGLKRAVDVVRRLREPRKRALDETPNTKPTRVPKL